MNERGLSLRTIAQRADVSHSHLSRALRGGTGRSASPELIAAVAVAFGLPEDYFPEVRHARVMAALRQRPDALNRLYDGLSHAELPASDERAVRGDDPGQWVLAASFARAGTRSDRATHDVLAALRALPGSGGDPHATALQRTLLAAAVDFARRGVSPRQHRRTSLTWAACVREAQRRLEAGASLRDDGFISQSSEGSDAAHLLEQVLIVAAADSSDDKLVHLGHLFAWTAFHGEVSATAAEDLVALGGRLSMRALLALGAVADREALPDWEAVGILGAGQQALLREWLAMAREGLLSGPDHRQLRGLDEINPAKVQLTASGSSLASAMGLGHAAPRLVARWHEELAAQSTVTVAPRATPALQGSTEPVTPDDLAHAQLRVRTEGAKHAMLALTAGEVIAVVRGVRMGFVGNIDAYPGELALRATNDHIDELREVVHAGDRLTITAVEGGVYWLT